MKTDVPPSKIIPKALIQMTDKVHCSSIFVFGGSTLYIISRLSMYNLFEFEFKQGGVKSLWEFNYFQNTIIKVGLTLIDIKCKQKPENRNSF